MATLVSATGKMVPWLLLLFVLTFGSSDGDESELFVLHSVAPWEGFNLRRDVQLRLAVAARLRAHTTLVLPPWSGLPHWLSRPPAPIPWRLYFDMDSLNSYTPTADLDQLLPITIDSVYLLTHFENAFENGTFIERWQFKERSYCKQDVHLWNYDIKVNRVQCVAFQGSASKLFQLSDSHPADKIVMFVNAEVALHDEYNTLEFWRARKSIVFNRDLLNIADEYIKKHLNCHTERCDNYISAHWRRRDFARSRGTAVPSVSGTARQMIDIAILKNISVIFVATDSVSEEFSFLINLVTESGIDVLFYEPTDFIESKYQAGGIAIIDQIVCSRAAYFVGTYESTFTYRIQEEREILGFDSDSTFNRFCPDSGECEKPSQWKIIRENVVHEDL